jgi:hypothetical protein
MRGSIPYMRKKTIIHVNQHHIRRNVKGENLPVFSVKSGRTNRYARSVEIRDPDGTIVARLVYRPDKPLSCGARVWIETYCTVVTDEITRLPDRKCDGGNEPSS